MTNEPHMTNEPQRKSPVLVIALTMTCMFFMSGLFGFGGAYFANYLIHANNGNHTDMETLSATDGTYQENSTIRLSTLSITGQNNHLTIPEIVELTADSVVEISTETVSTGGRMGQFISRGAGSGVIIAENGYIVTNNHVIEGARTINVHLRNGRTFTAELIGRDVKTDIAVLKINAANLSAAIYGNSDELVVGDLAIAIGNPLGRLGGTVTEGIISAQNRDIVIDGVSMNLLQTSAAINPGNSGGGLFNAKGELVGIVNAKSSGSDIEGLGFAIPVNIAKNVIDQIVSFGFVEGRVDLGITLVDISDFRTALSYRVQALGVYVLRTTENSPFQAGDRIISINGSAVRTIAEVNSVAARYAVGDTVTVTVQRGNQRVDVNLTLKQARS